MNAIERHYRLTTLGERMEQLAGELAVISSEMHEGPQQDQLKSAEWHLMRAAETVHAQPSPGEKQRLTTMLRLSIKQAREKKQCAEVGQTENAKGPTTPIASPFLNRQHATDTDSSGE